MSRCPSCGEGVEQGFVVCWNCGTGLAGGPGAQRPEDPETETQGSSAAAEIRPTGAVRLRPPEYRTETPLRTAHWILTVLLGISTIVLAVTSFHFSSRLHRQGQSRNFVYAWDDSGDCELVRLRVDGTQN